MTSEFLDARLKLLEDERLITRTLYAYGQALDYGDEAAWVDCFTTDGVFEVHWRASGTTKRVTGRDALTAFVALHSRAPEAWHKHMVVQPIIEVHGDTARCDSYALVLAEHNERPVPKDFGRYRDSLRHCTDGKWRFEKRIAEGESTDREVTFRLPWHTIPNWNE